MNMEFGLSFMEIMSAFIVLFAVIDITGLIPIVIDLKNKTNDIHAGKAALISLSTFLLFLFGGEIVLKLFGVDIQSFAVAGAVVIFIMSMEMVLGIEIFKNDGPKGSTTIVPLVFPLIAGAGSFTTLLSLRAEYAISNIIIALVLNIMLIYLVLRNLNVLEHFFGTAGIYVLRKFFGIILLAISVRLFTSNLHVLMANMASNIATN